MDWYESPRGRFAMALAADVLAAAVVALITEYFSRWAATFALSVGEVALGAPLLRIAISGQVIVQLAAALFLLVPRLLRSAASDERKFGRSFAAVLAFGVVTAALALWPSATALTSGAWISRQSFAGALRLGLVGVGGAAFALFLAMWFVWSRFERGRWRAALLVFTGILFGVAVFCNATVYPAQYLDGHLLLAVFGALTGQLLFRDLLLRFMERARSARTLMGAVAAVSLTAWGIWLATQLPLPSRSVSRLLFDAPRSAYFLMVLLPAPPSDEIEQRLKSIDYKRPYVAAARAPESRLRIGDDWNVVLIVVDTLRADALPPTRESYPTHRFDGKLAPFLTSLVDRSYRFKRAYSGAAYTYRSMPSLFRSRWGSEDPTTGTPIAMAMAEYGRTPIALVNDYFTEPWDPGIRAMLEGFAEVDVYTEHHQGQHLPLIKAALARHRNHPFFAWVHYYACHAPGWDGKAIGDGAEWPNNYVKAVNWVDGQVKQIFDELTKQGLADHTIVILTADHGEGLSDTGQMFHGTSVLEELLRVPLTIYIPGREGGFIDRTVGNVDILPTLEELMGGAPRHGQRGESLVPLLLDSEAAWNKPYVLMSGTGRQAGIVRGADKALLELRTGSRAYFQLDSDPLEDADRYDPANAHQRELLGELVEAAPQIFSEGLTHASTQSELDRALARVDPQRPPAVLPFLLSLVELSPTAEHLAWAENLFAKTSDDAVRLSVLERLFTLSPERLGALLTERLRVLADSPAEAKFVSDVASLRLPRFAGAYVAERFFTVSNRTSQEWLPWLRLVSTWKLSDPKEGAALRALLESLATSKDAAAANSIAIRLVLEALLNVTPSAMSPADRRATGDLLMERLVDDPSVVVAAGACRALGYVGDRTTAEPVLRAHLDRRPLLVRLRALEGLVDLVGNEALPEVARLGRESGFTVAAINLVGEIGDPAGEAFLAWALKEGPGRKSRTRIEVARARKAIREHQSANTSL